MESSERTFLAKGKAPETLYLSFSVIPVNRILTSRLTILESGPAFTRIVRMNNNLLFKQIIFDCESQKKKKKKKFRSVGLGQEQKSK